MSLLRCFLRLAGRVFLLLVVIVNLSVMTGAHQHQHNDAEVDASPSSEEMSCSANTEDGTCSATDEQHQQQQQAATTTTLDPALIQQAKSFKQFMHKIWDINDNYPGTNRTEQEWQVLQGVFAHVEMDPSVLLGTTKQLEYKNWYYELHRRIIALAPPDCFFMVYRTKPTDEQVQLIYHMDEQAVQEATSDVDGVFDDKRFRQAAFQSFRHRGGITAMANLFQIGILNPLKYWIGFAIPNDVVIQAIAALENEVIIEVGAGTGYWSAVLQQHGVNAIAYDGFTAESNVYFHHTYTTVHSGTCESIFSSDNTHTKGAAAAAMLIVWPNNPDNEDNDERFHSPSLPQTWDAGCLEAYMAAGGQTVIFVGEREENIHVMPRAPAESGLSATRRFQTMLETNFRLVQQIDIPHWWYSDDATIWKRKQS